MLTLQSLNRDIVSSEGSHKEEVMVVEYEEGEDRNHPETEMQDRVIRLEVQLQILVDALQDKKDRMGYMFERRERTPPKRRRIRRGFSRRLEQRKKGPISMVKNYLALPRKK